MILADMPPACRAQALRVCERLIKGECPAEHGGGKPRAEARTEASSRPYRHY